MRRVLQLLVSFYLAKLPIFEYNYRYSNKYS